MTSAPLPPALLPIVRYLDGLTGRAPLYELRDLLIRQPVTLRDVAEWAHFDEHRYRRNPVASGEWYELLLLCWRGGQRSPIHDHAGSTCAFRVLTGVCSETTYAFSPGGQVFPRHTVDQFAGTIVATQDKDTHQVSNLQAAGRDLVTLHIYSPPLKSMHTFSLYGEASRISSAPLVAVGTDGEFI